MEGKNIHSVCSLLKLYFRELPEPLLTYQLYEIFFYLLRWKIFIFNQNKLRYFHFISLAENYSSISHKIDYYRASLFQLPLFSRLLALKLLSFLNACSKHADKTSMNVENLGLVFSLNILRFALCFLSCISFSTL